MSDTTRYVKNQDMDKWITWGLTVLAGGAFSVGAWFFNGLNETQKELTKAVSGLRTEVAVLQTKQGNTARLRAQLAELKSDLKDSRSAVASVRDEQVKRTGNVYRVEQLSKQLSALEDRLKDHALEPHHKDAGRQFAALERRVLKLEERNK